MIDKYLIKSQSYQKIPLHLQLFANNHHFPTFCHKKAERDISFRFFIESVGFSVTGAEGIQRIHCKELPNHHCIQQLLA